MKKARTRKVIGTIFLLWIITLIGIVSLCFFLYKNTMGYITHSIGEYVNKSSLEISSKINQRIKVLEKISLELTEEMLNDPRVSIEYLSTYRKELGYNNLNIAKLDGSTVVSNGSEINLYDRDYFHEALSGKSTLGHVVFSKETGKPVNVYAVPIYRDNEIVAVLWGSVSVATLYEELDFSSIATFGEMIVIDSETNFIVGSKDKVTETNFYTYLEKNTVSDSVEENYQSIVQMKDDLKHKVEGYQKFKYDQHSFYIYYNQLKVNDWWVLLRIESKAITKFFGSQLKIVLFLVAFLFIMVNIGFYYTVYRLIKLNKDITEESYIDLVTGGKNDLYLKKYLSNLVKKQEQSVLIGVKVENADYLVKVLGLKRVEQKLRIFYREINKELNDNEIIVHSSFGDFKILKECNGIHSVVSYIDKINKMVPDLKLTIGICPLEEDLINYDSICSKITVARSNLHENCNYGFYSKDIHEELLKKNQLENDILEGFENEEFKAWFQPKYKSDGKTLVGAEALVRWYKDDKVLGPNFFVHLCETNHMIKELDLLILEDVCKRLKKWIQQEKKVVPISVNLSRDYLDQLDFIEKLLTIIEFYQIPENLLEFEITETSMEGNKENLIRMINILDQRGFKVALDDFGVGYSSIQTLVSMNFDTIKIDKVFVDGIGNEKWNNIIRYAISLCKQLRATIVAEGVETKEQLDFLASNGCDYIQGYYLGKPMDAVDFEKLID